MEQTCENCRHYGEDKRSRFCVMDDYSLQGYDGYRCHWWDKDDE